MQPSTSERITPVMTFSVKALLPHVILPRDENLRASTLKLIIVESERLKLCTSHVLEIQFH